MTGRGSNRIEGALVRPLLAAMLLLAGSQGFYLWLSLSKLGEARLKAEAAVESLALDRVGRRLDLVASLGLSLDRYQGLEREMGRARPGVSCFLLTGPEGRELAGSCSEPRPAVPAPAAPGGSISRRRQGDFLWLAREIEDDRGQTAGRLWLGLPRPRLGPLAGEFWRENYRGLVLTAAGSLLLLLAGLNWIVLRPGSPRRLQLVFLLPFLAGQIYFQGLESGLTDRLFREQALRTGQQAAEALAADLGRLTAQGLPPAGIARLGEHLDRLRERLPLVRGLWVENRQGATVAQSRYTSASGQALTTVAGFGRQSGRGLVRLELSAEGPPGLKRELFLEKAVLTLAAGLLLLELARLTAAGLPGPGREPEPSNPAGALDMRPIAFAAFLALDLSLSFIPLKMAGLRPALPGLSPELALSLPVSAEMLLAAAAMLAGGLAAGQAGRPGPGLIARPVFLAGGLALAALGALASALAASPGAFILARALAGFGYGLLNLGAQAMCAEQAGSQRRGEALGEMSAGCFSGGLCGCAAGGILADRFGFDRPFLVSAALLTALALLVLRLPSAAAEASGRPAAPSARPSWKKFLRARPVWGLGLFCVLPSSLLLVGLLNYFLPVYGASLGAGPSTISQVAVLFSLLVIVLGPAGGRRLDRARRPQLVLVWGGLISAAALGPILLRPDLAGLTLGLIMLGLASVINENGPTAWLLNRPESALVGSGPALSYINVIGRIGQVAGPLMLAWLWSAHRQRGLWLLAGGLGLCGLLFWWTARPGPEGGRDHEPL